MFGRLRLLSPCMVLTKSIVGLSYDAEALPGSAAQVLCRSFVEISELQISICEVWHTMAFCRHVLLNRLMCGSLGATVQTLTVAGDDGVKVGEEGHRVD